MNLHQLKKIVIDTVNTIENQGPIKMMGTQEGADHIPVVIYLDEPSLGPIASTEITSAMLGFDWNAGCFVIQAKDSIVRKSFLANSARKMNSILNTYNGDSQIYSCSECSCIVDETDCYCKSCGKKFKIDSNP